jgi:hypothetical protein
MQLRQEADDAYDQAAISSRTLQAIKEALGVTEIRINEQE